MKIEMNPKVKEVLEWIYCIVIAVVLAMIVRFYIGTPTIVKQPSMYPTLKENQRLWLNRWGRTIKAMPQKGDIITFEAPSETYLTEEQIEKGDIVAKYEDEPNSLFSKFAYYVLEFDKTSYIKRVIALPGEHVKIENGKVYINDNEYKESYLQPGVITDMSRGDLSDFTVPENCVFAMGDNRSKSTDCRSFGCIPLEKIESKVFIRFWPLNLFGKVE